MAASATLIFVGVYLLMGGTWPVAYGIACIVAGAVAWHVAEHARRNRLQPAERPRPRLAALRKCLGVLAGLFEIAAVLAIGGYAFDRPAAGLFNGFSFDALAGATVLGAALCIAAAQIHALKRRLSEDALAWLSPSRGSP